MPPNSGLNQAMDRGLGGWVGESGVGVQIPQPSMGLFSGSDPAAF